MDVIKDLIISIIVELLMGVINGPLAVEKNEMALMYNVHG